ncbi:hypothetical protein ABK040_016408 [Willaertia magna]
MKYPSLKEDNTNTENKKGTVSLLSALNEYGSPLHSPERKEISHNNFLLNQNKQQLPNRTSKSSSILSTNSFINGSSDGTSIMKLLEGNSLSTTLRNNNNSLYSINNNTNTLQYLINQLKDKVTSLSKTLIKTNTNLEDCQLSLQNSIKKQYELKNYYQSFIKQLTKQHLKKESDLQEEIDKLKELNTSLQKEIGQLKELNNSLQKEKEKQKEEFDKKTNEMILNAKTNTVTNTVTKTVTINKIENVTIDSLTDFSNKALSECKATKQDLQTIKLQIQKLNEFDLFEKFSTTILKKVQTVFNENSIEKLYQQKLVDCDKKCQFIFDNYLREMELRKSLQNQLIEERGSVRVCCRVRPLSSFLSETHLVGSSTSIAQTLVSSGRSSSLSLQTCIVDEQTNDTNISLLNKRGKVKSFELDQIYGMNTTQEMIFNDLKPLVLSAFDGYNACVLVFGETSSGKTYTMNGYGSQPGIIPRAINELYQLIERNREIYKIQMKLSVIEIYNNDVRDLLSSNCGPLLLRQQQQQNDDNNAVPSLSSFATTNNNSSIGNSGGNNSGNGISSNMTTEVKFWKINSLEQMKECIKESLTKRAESKTLMNQHSSRSHCIITVEIEKTMLSPISTTNATTPLSLLDTNNNNNNYNNNNNNKQIITRSILRFVDLAGSECIEQSGVVSGSEQFLESSFVNRSLSALEDVMVAMAQKRSHIPFRNSKLTQVLRDSVEGDSKMIIILTISPLLKFSHESLHALSFGARVKQVRKKKATRQIVVNKE